MPRVVKICFQFSEAGSLPKMTRSCWMLFAVLFLVCLQRSWSQMQLMDLMPNEYGLNYDSGWPPGQASQAGQAFGQAFNYMRLARDLKSQFFSSLTGDKQQQAAGAEGTKRRDRITALFIKLMTRLFRQRPFQRLLCGSNATCLANLNSPTF
ncbi:uncharacterized protein LOC129219244 isoform X2 [Uloborus diversus]|uniref:uncharacterized protein LOC129219244 isoform X2 n=1 Tax=Uloborus diversus TaxID=327109 RepID=UPI00240994C5|nr:uncharacterized protein LOC129219244 isoform X2 [Uloborus diversus]